MDTFCASCSGVGSIVELIHIANKQPVTNMGWRICFKCFHDFAVNHGILECSQSPSKSPDSPTEKTSPSLEEALDGVILTLRRHAKELESLAGIVQLAKSFK